jgi:hypothetical protein
MSEGLADLFHNKSRNVVVQAFEALEGRKGSVV